jgi:hypothetical protein
MNDDQRLLASAVLDGDVTADERARADADPEVVAEVERLRRTRDAVRVVDPPDTDRREAAIAAALAAFDRPERVTTPPRPSGDGRRHRWFGPLAAAAAIAVIAVGAVVAGRDRGGDDDLSTAEDAVEQSAAGAQPTLDRQANAIPAPAEDEASGAIAADTDATTATRAPNAPASPGDDEVQEATPTVAAVTLASPEELAAFATSRDRSMTAFVASCPGGTFVGPATYLVDGIAVAVEVSEVAAPHQAVARRVDDCVVVARAPLP